MTDRRFPRAIFLPDLGPVREGIAAAEQLAATVTAQGRTLKDQADHLSSIDDGLASLAVSMTAMANVSARLISSTGMLIDELPDPAPLVGRYARVTDLWGDATTDLVLAASSGGSAYWIPVRPLHAVRRAADASMTLMPLKSSPTQFLTGALTANRTLTLSPLRAWPGATFEIANDGTLGLFTLRVAGLALGEVLSLAMGSRRRFVFADGAWRSF